MKDRLVALALLLVALLLAASCTNSGPSNNDAAASPGSAEGGDSNNGDGRTSRGLNIDESALPGFGVTVTAARANWSIGYMQSAVFAALLEELGYTVTDPARNELPPGNGYVAMAEGLVDFWPSSLYPAHLEWHEARLTNGTSIGDHLVVLGEMMPAAGLEGLLITKSVADEFAIESLDQINADPELVAIFDGDGNGRADIFGCPEDWTCDDLLDATLERNGWGNLEQISAPYEGALAEAIRRVEADEAVIQYAWSPSASLADLRPGDNVLWLSLGDASLVCDGTEPCLTAWDHRDAAVADVGAACTQSPCVTGWEAADIVVTANADFVTANPAAGALFELVKIDVADAVSFGVRFNSGESTERDVRSIAAEWIAENRELVDAWLLEAVAAAG